MHCGDSVTYITRLDGIPQIACWFSFTQASPRRESSASSVRRVSNVQASQWKSLKAWIGILRMEGADNCPVAMKRAKISVVAGIRMFVGEADCRNYSEVHQPLCVSFYMVKSTKIGSSHMITVLSECDDILASFSWGADVQGIKDSPFWGPGKRHL